MRIWTLKLAGFVIWGLFLFIPFIAHADEGFDTYLPIGAQNAHQEPALFSFGAINMQFDSRALKIPVEDKWSVKLKAGEDTVLKNDLPAETRHDRVPLDNGGRESFRFGVGLNYQF